MTDIKLAQRVFSDISDLLEEFYKGRESGFSVLEHLHFMHISADNEVVSGSAYSSLYPPESPLHSVLGLAQYEPSEYHQIALEPKGTILGEIREKIQAVVNDSNSGYLVVSGVHLVHLMNLDTYDSRYIMLKPKMLADHHVLGLFNICYDLVGSLDD